VRLSLRAIERTASICDAIINHSFIQELVKGSLSPKTFIRYVEQDHLYLGEFSDCCLKLAAKAPIKYSKDFSKYAKRTLISEQEMLRKFLKEDLIFNKTGLITPANSAYVKHLRHNCTDNSLEIGVASALACPIIYGQIGIYCLRNSSANNPYARWVEACSSEEFSASAKRAVEIFDELADNTNEATRQKMLDVYTSSSWFEFRFFDDVYHQRYGAIKDSKDLPLIPNQIVQKPDAIKHHQSFNFELH
jgi:thiaminase